MADKGVFGSDTSLGEAEVSVGSFLGDIDEVGKAEVLHLPSGVPVADDPDDRMPMVWADLKFEPQTLSPGGQPARQDDLNFDSALHDYYRDLISLLRVEVVAASRQQRRRQTYRHQCSDRESQVDCDHQLGPLLIARGRMRETKSRELMHLLLNERYR